MPYCIFTYMCVTVYIYINMIYRYAIHSVVGVLHGPPEQPPEQIELEEPEAGHGVHEELLQRPVVRQVASQPPAHGDRLGEEDCKDRLKGWVRPLKTAENHAKSIENR